MRRTLIAFGLLLALGSATAQPKAVPNTFEAGSPMSASAMNANLEAINDWVIQVREQLITTRRDYVSLRNRVAVFAPYEEDFHPVDGSSLVAPQQDEEPLWPFKAGDLVDADAVNESFARFVADQANFNEFFLYIVRDIAGVSRRLAATEEAHGLPNGDRPDAEFQDYVATQLTQFNKNERIVPAEVNANFASLVEALTILEANALEVDAWLRHEIARADGIEPALEPPTLEAETYLLRLQGTLDPEDFSEGTYLDFTAVSAVFSDGSYRPHVPNSTAALVSAAGTYDLTIDARDLLDEGVVLTPHSLANWFLPHYDTSSQTRTLYVSDPNAQLQIVNSVIVVQDDGKGSAGSTFVSHSVGIPLGTDRYSVWAQPVFADRPLSITGMLGSIKHDFTDELEVDLEPGWNLIYIVESPEQPTVTTINSRPVTDVDQPQYAVLEKRFGIIHGASEVRGYALFPSHEIEPGGQGRALFRAERPNSQPSFYAMGPNWINHNLAPMFLVPAGDLSTSVPNAFSTDDVDARLMLGVLLAYDQSAVNAGALGDVPAAIGQLVPESEATNPIAIIYSDRSTMLHADPSAFDGSGAPLMTDAEGLPLYYGWNLLEVVPNEPGSPDTLRRYALGKIPTMKIAPFNVVPPVVPDD